MGQVLSLTLNEWDEGAEMTDSGRWFQMGTQLTKKEDWYNVVLANGVRRGMEWLVLGLGRGFGVKWEDGITEWPNKIHSTDEKCGLVLGTVAEFCLLWHVQETKLCVHKFCKQHRLVLRQFLTRNCRSFCSGCGLRAIYWGHTHQTNKSQCLWTS